MPAQNVTRVPGTPVTRFSVIPEQIPRVNLLLHIIQNQIIPIRRNHVATLLESFHIVDNQGAKERRTIFECRFVDDDCGAFCFDALHDTLNR